MNISKGNEIIFRCYSSSQKILLVGEGDFSFSACLARKFNKAQNIVATSYLDEDVLVQKHWSSVPHLEELERLGALLLYEVDVNTMHTHPILKNIKFDVIIFNFPHAGHYYYLRERDLVLIEMHRKLVGSFFKSASKMLNEGGEVHLRHRADPPYDEWNVVLLAGESGLQLQDKEYFQKIDYPGYHNKRGGNDKTNKTFPILCAFTYKFAIDLPKVDDHSNDDEYIIGDGCAQKINEVIALEMMDQVNDDNHVLVLDMKDQHCDQKHLKIDEVTAPFRKDEVDRALVKKDNVKDLYVHKYELIVNLSKKLDRVHDDSVVKVNNYQEEHSKNAVIIDDIGVVHGIIEMKEDEDEKFSSNGRSVGADLFKKDEVHVDLDLPKVGDDGHSSKIVQVNEVETKDHNLDKQHPPRENDDVGRDLSMIFQTMMSPLMMILIICLMDAIKMMTI